MKKKCGHFAFSQSPLEKRKDKPSLRAKLKAFSPYFDDIFLFFLPPILFIIDYLKSLNL